MLGRAAATALLAVLVVPGPAARASAPGAVFRIDQAGYFPGQDGYAALMSTQALSDPQVAVVRTDGTEVAQATVTDRGRWSATYQHVYAVEFTAPAAGRYRLSLAGGTRSPQFPVTDAADVWSTVLRYGVRFDQVQRDGADVVPTALDRRPSHLHDAHATVYETPHFRTGSDEITDADLTPVAGADPVDVEGGWFDAGDYLKFTHSTAYADVLLFTAARDLGGNAPKSVLAEARHGIDWLDKMWDSANQVLYLQVGVGSGNSAGTFRGDHDGWRLPQADDGDTATQDRYVSHRPVFRAAAPGQPISPNLAGRVSAAFALAAQADAASDPARAQHEYDQATSLYALADVDHRGRLTTALPFAFYPEFTWHDDMELGAVEIARAAEALGTGAAQQYLHDAGRWAKGYLRTETGDTFNLYDTAALAHTDLIRTMGASSLAVTKAQLVADLRRQLNGAQQRSDGDQFAAGVDDTEFDVDSHTLGLVATEGWYRSVSGDDRFVPLATRLRGWVFGANAWGVSFMVGIGTAFPHCMQHQVANLSGTVDGTAPLDLGAVVNGPNGAGLFDGGLGGFQGGMVHCPGAGAPPAVPAGRFDGSGSVYLDDVRSWQTDEPALDMTGAAIAAAAAQLAAS